METLQSPLADIGDAHYLQMQPGVLSKDSFVKILIRVKESFKCRNWSGNVLQKLSSLI